MRQTGQARPEPIAGYQQLVGQVRAWREAGDYRRAEQLARVGIATVERSLGPDAAELAVLLNELGVLGKYLGNFVEAERLYRRALAIHARNGVTASAGVAAILHNLAGVAHARGDVWVAESVGRRGVAMREALADADRAALVADRAALAATLIDAGKLGEARALLDVVLRDHEQRYGQVHHEIGVTLHNLGALQYRGGDIAVADSTLRRAVAVKREALGPRHPDLAITLHNLACCAQRLGNVVEAVAYTRQAIAILEPVVAETQPTLLACRAKLEQLLSR